MTLRFHFRRQAMVTLMVLVALASSTAVAKDQERPPCTEDAMIVFDASGSMAGNMNQGIATTIPRIHEVRRALGRVLPKATRFRRVGLITYGPGPYEQCNAEAVGQAAEVLDFRAKPGTIVVLTDGEETCGGAPCDLGKRLHAQAAELTIHVIGFQMKDFYWTGEQSVLDVKCLAESNGGLYITAQNQEELVEAFEKTLGCPMMSQWVRPEN